MFTFYKNSIGIVVMWEDISIIAPPPVSFVLDDGEEYTRIDCEHEWENQWVADGSLEISVCKKGCGAYVV
jgi:hypothetical protein